MCAGDVHGGIQRSIKGSAASDSQEKSHVASSNAGGMSSVGRPDTASPHSRR